MSFEGHILPQSCHHRIRPLSYGYLKTGLNSPDNGPFPTERNQKSDTPSPGFSACFPKGFLLKFRFPGRWEPTCDGLPRKCASGFRSWHCRLIPAGHGSGPFLSLVWRRQWRRRHQTCRRPLQQSHNDMSSRIHPQFHETVLNLFHFKGSGHHSGSGTHGCRYANSLPHIGTDGHDAVIGMGHVST